MKKKKGYFWIILGILMGATEVINGAHDFYERYKENNPKLEDNQKEGEQ